jgi:hypothetical protein
MNAESLTRHTEVADGAERIRADEDPLLPEPEGDLAPEPLVHDAEDDEWRAGHIAEWRHVQWNVQPPRDRGAIARVPVEELDDARRLAQLADPLVEPVAVDHVGQPDATAGAHRV